ncbi:MAG: hypothetical protein IKD55_06115 [Sediminibacterium sp.]|nr:hypothetical protein [Sediminibacterium sp.]
MRSDYDYIITGGGCAGLSLLFRFHKDPYFQHKKILVIDAVEKKQNDRTWCFWEKQPGIFESIVHHSWDQIEFLGYQYKLTTPILPYQYKMIKGIDFYNYIQEETKSAPNISWLQAAVTKIYTDKNGLATVECGSMRITSQFIFNSIIFEKPILRKHQYYFLQHFVGWEIESVKPCFDPSIARFMDFSIPQKNGTCFMYVLPLSNHRALVEYTLFTQNLLAQNEYDEALTSYIANQLNIQEYTIEHVEKGIIPMTNFRYPEQEKNIIHIGIAANQAKASSGYAFQFIQKRTGQIINVIKKDNLNFSIRSFNDKKAALYDATLLRVLKEGRMGGADIFTKLFQKNKVTDLFMFLDNESSFIADIKIMNSVPTRIFLPAALKQMFASI